MNLYALNFFVAAISVPYFSSHTFELLTHSLIIYCLFSYYVMITDY
jgi:hypothetical protein